MNVRASAEHQWAAPVRATFGTAVQFVERHRHQLWRWIVIGFCFATSCAYAQRGVTLAWDRNTETNIAGYKVHYGIASRAYTSSINVGNVTTASVTNLVAGVTYLFAVTAYNSAGAESDFSAEVSHTVTNSVTTNLPPTLAAIGDLTINEDSGLRSVSLTGITSGGENQTLSVTVSGTPELLIPSVQVSYTSPNNTGTLSFTTAPNSWGTGTVSVTVSDGLAQTTRSFSVIVNPVNDPPTIAALPAAIVPPQTITALQPAIIADIDTAASNLVVVGTSSDTNVLPQANILIGTTGLTRTLSVQPLRTGVATVTLRVSDGFAQSSQSFLLTVTNATGLVQMRASYDPAINAFTISWDSQIGAMYRILSKDSLAEPDWINVTGNIRATATRTSWADLTAGRQSSAFYIIEMVSPGRTDPP